MKKRKQLIIAIVTAGLLGWILHELGVDTQRPGPTKKITVIGEG